MPWEEVKKEMVFEKGLDEAVADKIGEYVKLSGTAGLCDILIQDSLLSKSKEAIQGIEEMKLLFKYLSIFEISHKV